jgi:hypothetical protein
VADDPDGADALDRHVGGAVALFGHRLWQLRHGAAVVSKTVNAGVAHIARGLVVGVEGPEEARADGKLPRRRDTRTRGAEDIGDGRAVVGGFQSDHVVDRVADVGPKLDRPSGHHWALRVPQDVDLAVVVLAHLAHGVDDVFGRDLDVSQRPVWQIHGAHVDAGVGKRGHVVPVPALRPGQGSTVHQQRGFPAGGMGRVVAAQRGCQLVNGGLQDGPALVGVSRCQTVGPRPDWVSAGLIGERCGRQRNQREGTQRTSNHLWTFEVRRRGLLTEASLSPPNDSMASS